MTAECTDLKLEIVNANEYLISEIIELNKKYFDADSYMLDPAYFQWFYLNNPVGKARLVTVRIEQDLVGIMALIPISISNTHTRCYYAANVLTHPEHRDKNIFVKMIRCTVNVLTTENAVLIGHPNQNAIPAWKRTRMNFRECIKPFFVKPNFLGLKTKNISINNLSLINNYFSKSREKRLAHLSIETNYDYILWKYISNPVRKYKVNLVYDNNEAIGLYVSLRYFGLIDIIVHYEFINTCYSLSDLPLGLRVVFHSNKQIDSTLFNINYINIRFIKKDISYFVSPFSSNSEAILSYSDDLTLNSADF